MNTSCYSCGTEVPAETARQRSALCVKCGKELKVCLNCRFYTPGAHWDCAENIGELVKEKDRSNFCDWFSAKPPGGLVLGSSDKKSDAKKRFDDLFGG